MKNISDRGSLAGHIENILSLPDCKIIVLGLGVSNLPLARMLVARGLGAHICVRDGKTLEALGAPAAELAAAGVEFVTGAPPADGIYRGGDASHTVIFRSPGIRPDSGGLPDAVAHGACLTSEMEWFCSATPAHIYAVTGSDGKTTTTTLTHLLLSGSKTGGRVWVGGNIGTPLLDRTAGMTPDDDAVLELSSFQLQTMSGPADRAAITNISPNHLNWHTDMKEYTEAKYRVFGSGTELLVLNAGNEPSRAAADRFDGSITFFSAKTSDYESTVRGRTGASALFLRDGDVIFSDGRNEEALLKTSDILLPGLHNTENYMTAIALTRGHVTSDVIRDVAAHFAGVEHRLEYVRTLDGVKYYNSSIDSSPSRTAAALSTLSCRPVVICGGQDKHVPFEPLAEALFARASAAVLTGDAAGQISDAIDRVRAANPDIPHTLTVVHEDDFTAAVYAARSLAKPGSAVLLSPACTSFDRFLNFEERGNTFKAIVNDMKPSRGGKE